MARTPTEPLAVARLVDRIVEQFRPQRIILFGSHAIGTADDGSDIDLLVVMETSEPLLRQAAAIYRALDHEVPVDIFVRTPDQVAVRSPRDLILRTILEEGVTLYEAGD
jgi:predicted nucleotidyltransferase